MSICKARFREWDFGLLCINWLQGMVCAVGSTIHWTACTLSSMQYRYNMKQLGWDLVPAGKELAPSPNQFQTGAFTISVKSGVFRNQNQVFSKRLPDKQPVKWIAMVKREHR